MRSNVGQDVGISSQGNWRVFCAINLPERAREAVMRYIASLRELFPQVHAAWSREGNIHLTLKFLGEIPRTSIHNLSDAASRAAAGFEPFTIFLDQTGVFPTHGLPRVLWIGINDWEGKLARLHGRLEEECAKAGFKNEARPFHSHLTVARLREPRHARTLASAHNQMGFERSEITVSELLVIRSELRSEGSKHTVISSHAIGTRATCAP